MQRVVSLFLPFWPVDRLRRSPHSAAPPPEVPLALVHREGGRRVLYAVDPAARRLGLVRGMAAAKAQALVPGLTLLPADPAADHEGLHRLALWALRHLSPVVALDPPDGLLIETSGADHLHGGEAAMLAFLIDRFAGAGVTARAAVAQSRGAAHAAARFLESDKAVIAPGAVETLLKPLPLKALRLAPALVREMRMLGFERVCDIFHEPRAPLALRFGPEPGRRLDQALGRIGEPFDPVRPPDPVEARRLFGEPIGAAETIARYIAKLVAVLCPALERRGLGARRLDLLFRRVDSGFQAIRVGTATPVRDEKRLTRLLCEKIETVDPGFGIEEMILTATLAEPFVEKQATSSLSGEVEADLSGLVDVLANRLGAGRLYRFEPVESDVPERSVLRVPPLAPGSPPTWSGEWPRPARLLPRPERIETMALLPDHPPVWFSWRGVRRRIRAADGPERIFGEWWKRAAERAAVRDYFRVEDEAGERFWIFRSGNGEDPETGSHDWFLHGIFG